MFNTITTENSGDKATSVLFPAAYRVLKNFDKIVLSLSEWFSRGYNKKRPRISAEAKHSIREKSESSISAQITRDRASIHSGICAKVPLRMLSLTGRSKNWD